MDNDLNELFRALGRIESKVDGLGAHETRISFLENRYSWLKGGLAFLGALWAVGVTLAGFLLN